MAQMLTGPVSGIIGEHGGWRLSFLALGLFAIGTGATLTARFGVTLWQRPERPGLTAVPGPVAYLRLLRRPIGQWLLLSAFFDGLCLFGGAFPYVGACNCSPPLPKDQAAPGMIGLPARALVMACSAVRPCRRPVAITEAAAA